MGRKRAGAWAQRAKIKWDHTGCHPNKIRGNYNMANSILINKAGKGTGTGTGGRDEGGRDGTGDGSGGILGGPGLGGQK
ncbi:hypothetical protein MTR67_005824 [Solanum verrucosum]|uniref:Uncharacterized protein n=1 Tax=Solanum verrucosum TaxID=315347 RepID=A0AAF0Q2V7_SOLVR|nr:hypothetical protein MTR67_005824 [Solanum verrucosum]